MVLKSNKFIKLYSFKSKAKLQTISLKLGSTLILHPKILEFGFYSLKFGSVWILHPEVSKIRFYQLTFYSACISSLFVYIFR